MGTENGICENHTRIYISMAALVSKMTPQQASMNWASVPALHELPHFSYTHIIVVPVVPQVHVSRVIWQVCRHITWCCVSIKVVCLVTAPRVPVMNSDLVFGFTFHIHV